MSWRTSIRSRPRVSIFTLTQDNGGWNINNIQFATSATPTNVAAGKPTRESSHNQTYISSNATDTDQNTYWESANNAFPQWLQVDLGSTQNASRIVLQPPASWGARNQTLSILASTDGTNLTTMAMLSRPLEAHEIVIAKVRDAIETTANNGDAGTNDLLTSNVLRTNEMQLWFVAEHLVEQP